MGLVCKAFRTVPTTLAKVDRDGEGSSSRDDVDRGSSGEVKSTEDEGPAVGVPCPAGDGVVDNGCPNEDEDEDRAELSTFSNSSYCEGSAILIERKSKCQL